MPPQSLPSRLLPVAEFDRNAVRRVDDVNAGLTRLSGLSPTLRQDLLRHDPSSGPGLDLLQVLAAALRHGRALQVFLEQDYRVVPLAFWPLAREIRTPLGLQGLLGLRLAELRVMRVEAAPTLAGSGIEGETAPIGPLLWELALRGARGALLPEIAGPAVYRIAPGSPVPPLESGSTLAQAVERLRTEPTPLRLIARWPGFDVDRACRFLNALYLQSGLMVSRTHPLAVNEP